MGECINSCGEAHGLIFTASSLPLCLLKELLNFWTPLPDTLGKYLPLWVGGNNNPTMPQSHVVMLMPRLLNVNLLLSTQRRIALMPIVQELLHLPTKTTTNINSGFHNRKFLPIITQRTNIIHLNRLTHLNLLTNTRI